MAKVAPGIPGATFAISGVITAPSTQAWSRNRLRTVAARATAYHGAISMPPFWALTCDVRTWQGISEVRVQPAPKP